MGPHPAHPRAPRDAQRTSERHRRVPGASDLADSVERWELCAFNNLCRDKYDRLGMEWQFAETPLMTKAELDAGWRRGRKASGFDPQRIVRHRRCASWNRVINSRNNYAGGIMNNHVMPFKQFSEQDIQDLAAGHEGGHSGHGHPRRAAAPDPDHHPDGQRAQTSGLGAVHGGHAARSTCRQNPKTGFLIMGLDKNFWRGKADYTIPAKDGQGLRFLQQHPALPLQRLFRRAHRALHGPDRADRQASRCR